MIPINRVFKASLTGLSAVTLTCALVSLSGCLSSREKPFVTLEREAYGSLDTANKAARRLDYDGASSYFERACNQFAAIDSMRGFILCTIDTAALYLKTGRDHEAEDLLLQAIQLAGRHREPALRGTAHVYLAFMYLGQKNHEKTIHEIDLALPDLTDSEEKRRAMQYRAEALLEMGQTEEAIKTAGETFGSNIPGRDSYAHTIIARCQMKLGNSESAVQSVEKAVQLDREEGISDLLAYDYELLSQIFERSGNPDRAVETGTRALHIYLAINRIDAAKRLVRRLIPLQKNTPDARNEIERLNRISKRIEKLK